MAVDERVEADAGAAQEPRDVDADGLLVTFLSGRDVACAACGYNLRDLASVHCPECRQRLVLSVDVESRGLWSVVASVAPGFGCGLIWLFFAIMTVLEGPPPTRGRGAVAFWGAWAFLTASVLVAALLASASRRVFGRPGPRRIALPVVIWVAHVFALLFFIALVS